MLMLTRLNADILCCQEALDFQIKEVLERFPGYRVVGVGRDDGLAAGEHCAIFYRSHFREIASGTFWLSEHPEDPGSVSWGNHCTRICTWLELEGCGKIINLHLDHESSLGRRKGVELVLTRADPSSPTVIAGDFNVGEGNEAIAKVREKGFIDTYRQIHSEGQAPTFHGFGQLAGEKIDYIFANRQWQVNDASRMTDQIEERWPSDHVPLIADLTLT